MPSWRALNPGAKLPATPITVAYRSDGSGTTAVFTEYLAKVSPEWKTSVGAGKSVKFPIGLGGKGNEGVTGLVKSTPGAIGYVELAYAKQNQMAIASIRNQAGKFVEPSLEGVTAAATGQKLPEDLCLSLVDRPGAKTYPISSFSYILVYQEQQDATKGKALADFLWWAIHDGQKLGAALDYAPLPKDLAPGHRSAAEDPDGRRQDPDHQEVEEQHEQRRNPKSKTSEASASGTSRRRQSPETRSSRS